MSRTQVGVPHQTHFWLDIFNSWIWVWGFPPRFPALFVPKEVAKEAVKEFYAESEKLFEVSIPALTVDETLSWMLTSLKKHTYLGASNVNPAVKNMSTFIGREIEYKDIDVEVEEKYYKFLNDFFVKW